jgi:hypothetical protein
MRRLALLLAGLLLAGCNREPEFRTIELRYMEPESAMKLLGPYLSGVNAASTSSDPPLITLRGQRAQLDEIAAVLARYDRPQAVVRFRFQIVEADGFASTDSAIADVDAALRDLFRFRGYRLAAEAVTQAEAPGLVRQQVVMPDGTPIQITVEVKRVFAGEAGTAVAMNVDMAPFGRSILSTALTVPSGKTAVVGSARADADRPTLILVVRPEIQ